MPDDFVAIQPISPQVPQGDPQKIKTFLATDLKGNIVEIQALVVTNEYGASLNPMTEATGRALLDMLTNLYNLMATATGAGLPL